MAAKRKRTNRAPGTGTIQRQPNGTFIARTADKSRSGRFPDRPSAEAALEQWNKALGLGRDPNEGRQRLRDFGRQWLVTVCAPKVQPSTLEFYTRHLGYATAIIGDLSVELVDTRDIERTLSRLRADGLSPRSVNHVRAVLRNLFNVAMRWKLRSDNPATDAPEWRVDEDTGAPPLTAPQVATLLAAVADDRLCALYHVGLTLGLRRGELLALRWSDLDGDVLHVRETVKEGEGRQVITGTTKSRQARDLPLPADLSARLEARRDLDEAEGRTAQQRAAEKAQAAGEPVPLLRWNPAGLVFCSEAGTLIQPSNFNRAFGKLVTRANKAMRERAGREAWPEAAARAATIPEDASPHSLRKTALTDLAAHGEAKAVQSIAGHADIDTTMRVYAGRRMAAMRAAVEAVERERRTG